jgi:hypothetical protein
MYTTHPDHCMMQKAIKITGHHLFNYIYLVVKNEFNKLDCITHQVVKGFKTQGQIKKDSKKPGIG